MSRDLLLRRGWTLPLLLSLFVDNVRGTPVRAAALVLCAAWAFSVAWAYRRPLPFHPLFLGFLAWCAAGLFFSEYRAGTLAEFSLLGGAALLFSGFAAVRERHPEEDAFVPKVFLAAALLKGVSCLLLPSPGGRPFLNPGDAGTANTSLAAMFLAAALLLGERRTAPWRVAWAVAAAVTLWLCVRWNAVSALLGLAGGFLLEQAFRRRARGLFAGAAAAFLGAGIFVMSPAAPAWLQYNPDNPGRWERLAIWRDSLRYAADHPLLGTGLGTFEQHYPQYKSLPGLKTANFAHNEWIQAACETGLPGAALLLALLWLLARRLRDRGAAAPRAAAVLVLLALWACIYYPFRSDALLFTGALLLASFCAPGPEVLAARRVFTTVGFLVFLSALFQGGAQFAERWGGVAWDAGRVEDALSRFRLASRLDPGEPRYLDHQVECLRRLNRKEEALDVLEKAIPLKPRDIWLRRKLSLAKLHLQGPAAARDAYAPVLSLAPNVEQFRKEYDDLK